MNTNFDREQYEKLLSKATNVLMEQRIDDDERALSCIEKTASLEGSGVI